MLAQMAFIYFCSIIPIFLLQGLDPASRRNLWDVVKSAKEDKAIILTTHSMKEAEVLCDRLGIFVNGRLMVIGNPKELTGRYGEYLVRSPLQHGTRSIESQYHVEHIDSQCRDPKFPIDIECCWRPVEFGMRARFFCWGVKFLFLQEYGLIIYASSWWHSTSHSIMYSHLESSLGWVDSQFWDQADFTFNNLVEFRRNNTTGHSLGYLAVAYSDTSILAVWLCGSHHAPLSFFIACYAVLQLLRCVLPAHFCDDVSVVQRIVEVSCDGRGLHHVRTAVIKSPRLQIYLAS